MKRKALLIGAAPLTFEPTPGVLNDLHQWNSFLRSLHGGAWYDKTEIVSLYNQSSEIILKEVSSMTNHDYALILFAGHGEIKKDYLGLYETFLFINENDKLSERDLNPGNSRCMIFLDCCRTKSEETDVILESEYIVKAASELNEYEILKYREQFDKYVLKCEKGCTKVYAAKLDQEADDTNSFSKILLRFAILWSKKNFGLLSIDKAMDMTKTFFSKVNPQQSPRYQGGRRLHHYPFAINLEDLNA